MLPACLDWRPFGLQVGQGNFGHGGAYARNMTIDAEHGIITVLRVRPAGFPGNGKESGGAFKAAAVQAFGSPK